MKDIKEDIKKDINKFKIFSKDFIKLYYKIILLILLLSIWNFYYNRTFGDSFLNLIVKIIIYYWIINLIFNYGSVVFVFFYRRKYKHESNYEDNFIFGIRKLSFFLNNVFFLFIFLHLVGFDTKEFLTSISIFAVAIVLIFREFITNFLNGINLMFSTTLNIKDYVKIGDNKGKVSDLNFQNIEIKTDEGDYVYIPNNLVQSKEITNFSKESLKKIKTEFSLKRDELKYYNKIKTKIIEETFKKFNTIISKKENISVNIEKIEHELVKITVGINVSTYKYKLEEEIKKYVNEIVINIISKEKK